MYTPTFICKYCGNYNKAFMIGSDRGVFTPCQCEESRKNRDREHYLQMERKKALRKKK